ncbi:MAG: hypothetical protein CFE34_00010 [Rhodobacteraceae bacterium PARR1]|nr:MAG: hypothetical protein CFE34_00010 [Rhodobacteraceae bacterium PARR1]
MSRVNASPDDDCAALAQVLGTHTLMTKKRTRLPMQAGLLRFVKGLAARLPRRLTGFVCQSPFGLPSSAAPMTGIRT